MVKASGRNLIRDPASAQDKDHDIYTFALLADDTLYGTNLGAHGDTLRVRNNINICCGEVVHHMSKDPRLVIAQGIIIDPTKPRAIVGLNSLEKPRIRPQCGAEGRNTL